MKKQTWFLTLASIAVLAGLATAAHADDDNFIPDINQYSCNRAAGAIVLDGKLDDAAWKDAFTITRFYDVQNEDRTTLPRGQVTLKFLHDATNLYVGAVIRDRDIVYDPEHLNKDKETLFLDGDTFELFLQPDKNSSRYFEMHVNPNNVIWDAAFPARNYMRFLDPTKWNAGMKSAVTIQGTVNKLDEDESWTVEMAVPLSSFTDQDGKAFSAQAGTMWRFSACLYDYSYYYDDCDNGNALKYYSTSKYPRLDFHQRGNFNFLKFE